MSQYKVTYELNYTAFVSAVISILYFVNIVLFFFCYLKIVLIVEFKLFFIHVNWRPCWWTKQIFFCTIFVKEK